MIEGMTKAMHQMAYYLVIMFFIAQFVYAFGHLQPGRAAGAEGRRGASRRMAIAGRPARWWASCMLTANRSTSSLGPQVRQVGPAGADFRAHADVNWASPPDLTQAAYRVGDSSTNIITPLMPYFPLVVVYCQRYVKTTGIGTLAAMMLPYSITFLIAWTAFLVLYWMIGIPLGLQSSYEYMP